MYRDCPICGIHRSTLLFIKSSASYVKCDSCDLVYVGDTLSDNFVKDMYHDEGDKYFIDKTKLDLDFDVNRYRFESNVFDNLQFDHDAKILEIGCATGSFINRLGKMGYKNVEGVDISGPSIQYAKSIGLRCREGDFLNMNYDRSFYDCIIMWATLEHLLRPKSFCEEAYKCLKKDGYLLISVPNYKSLTQKILGKKDRYVSIGHLNYFTSKTLSSLLVQVGFEIVKEEFHAFNPINIYQDFLNRSRMDQPAFKIKSQGDALRIKNIIKNNFVLEKLYVLFDNLLNISRQGDLMINISRKREIIFGNG